MQNRSKLVQELSTERFAREPSQPTTRCNLMPDLQRVLICASDIQTTNSRHTPPCECSTVPALVRFSVIYVFRRSVVRCSHRCHGCGPIRAPDSRAHSACLAQRTFKPRIRATRLQALASTVPAFGRFPAGRGRPRAKWHEPATTAVIQRQRGALTRPRETAPPLMKQP